MYSSNNTSCRSPVNLNSVWNTTFVTRSEEIEKKTWQTTTENRLKILFSMLSFFSYIYRLLIKRSTNFSQDCSRSLTMLIKLGFHNVISTSTSIIISNNNGRKDAHNTSISTNTEKQNKGLRCAYAYVKRERATARPGSNTVLHMSRTQFNQLGPCEVRRLTQSSPIDFG